MKTYNIAGIKLAFHYEHDGYFNNNIEKYLTDEKAEYTLEVKTVANIEKPINEPSYTYKNRHIHHEDGKHTLIVYTKNNAIKIRMDHTLDYKTQTIYLHQDYIEDLAEMEYVLSGLQFMQLALHKNMLPLHASAIAYQDQAILFAASSGTGKSTHTTYWQKTFDEVFVINDDKPLIFKENNQFMVTGSPWSGKNTINENITLPLKAIVFLDRGERNTVTKLSKDKALNRFMKDCMRPGDATLMDKTLSLIESLINQSHYYHYQVTNSPDSVNPIYQAIFKEDSHED